MVSVVLIKNQWRIIINHLIKGERHKQIVKIGLVLLGFLAMFGIYLLTNRGLDRMADFTPLAKAIADKVFELLVMIIIATLLLSSALNALSALFLSKDSPWLAMQPINKPALFSTKFHEVYLLSAWMVLVFGLPVFYAYGTFFNASALYYLFAILGLAILAIFPVCLGIIIVVLLVNILPANRFRDILVFITLVTIFGIFLIIRSFQPERLSDPEAVEYFTGALVGLSIPWMKFLPSMWVTNILRALLRHQNVPVIDLWYLISSAGGLYIVTQWLFEIFFPRGLSRALGSQPPLAARSRFWNKILHIYLFPYPSKIAAIAKKDILTMLRDSTQWSQILILAAIVIVYIVNVQAFPIDQLTLFGLKQQQARDLLGLLNIILIGLVMAAVGSRFLFTGISLESNTIWLVRSAPLTAKQLLWSKIIVGLPPCLGLGLIILVITNSMLNANSFVWITSLTVIPVLSLGISGLGVGFGAIMPNFKASNAAQIVAGLGGMTYMVISLAYVLASGALLAWPMSQSWRHNSFHWQSFIPFYCIFLTLSWGAASAALWAGRKRWHNLQM